MEETVKIPCTGIETRAEKTFGVDGTFSKVKNLVPAGPDVNNPIWKPIEKGGTEPFNLPSSTGFAVESAYWQKRTHKPQGDTSDLSRWLLVLDNWPSGRKGIYPTRSFNKWTAIASEQSLSSGVTDPQDHRFSLDGTKVFFLTSDSIDQWTLNAAWDISSKSSQVTQSLSGQSIADATAFCFNSDHTVLYVENAGSSNTIYQYDLSTADDLSTITYSTNSYNHGYSGGLGLEMADDSENKRVVLLAGTRLYKLLMSEANDISTASGEDDYSVSSYVPDGIRYVDNGMTMILFGGNYVYAIGLYSSYQIEVQSPTTIPYYSLITTTITESYNDTETNPTSVSLEDGKLFVVGTTTDNIEEFEVTTTPTYVLDKILGELFSVYSENSIWVDDPSVKTTTFNHLWQKINSQDVALSLYNDDEAHLIYVIDDSAYLGAIRSKYNNYYIRKDAGVDYSSSDYPDGGYPGYLAGTVDKYVGAMLVWKLKSTELYIKHSNPFIVKIESDASNTYGLLLGTPPYDTFVSVDDYECGEVNIIQNEFTNEIEGPFISLTVGFDTYDDALNSSNYFVIGAYNDLPSYSTGEKHIWVAEDAVSTYEVLNIDPLSHHKKSGKALGSYRQNLLVGNSMLDFVKPGWEWWKYISVHNWFLRHSSGEIFDDWTRTDIYTATNSVDERGVPDELVLDPASSGTPNISLAFNPHNGASTVKVKIRYYTGVNFVGDVDITGGLSPTVSGDSLTAGGTKETPLVYEKDINQTSGVITLQINLTYDAGGDDELFLLSCEMYYDTSLYYTYLVEATIKTNQGSFKRFSTLQIPHQRYEDFSASKGFILPEIVSYPDIRATELTLWRDNGAELYVHATVPLTPHAGGLNMAYHRFGTLDERLHSSIDYDNSSADPTTENVFLKEPDKWFASNLNEFDFPLERTYRVGRGDIQGFADNTSDMGQGQFGQFPLYVFTNRNIIGVESSSGLFASRIVTVAENHGVLSPLSYVAHKGVLFFTSSHGIHTLSGNTVDDIHLPLEQYGGIDFLNTFFSGELHVGVNVATDEIVFTDTANYTFILNLKYGGRWSEGTISLDGDDHGELIQKEEYLYFKKVTSAVISKWRDGSDDVNIEMTFNPITLGSYAQAKRLFEALLLGRFKTAAATNNLVITLEGRKSANDSFQTLCSYTFDQSTDKQNLYMRSNYGSLQEYKMTISGDLSQDSYIHELIMRFERRGKLII